MSHTHRSAKQAMRAGNLWHQPRGIYSGMIRLIIR